MTMEKPFKVNKAANVGNYVGYRHPVFLGFRHEDDIDNKF